MANRIGSYMENYGTKFIRGSVPLRIEKPDPNGRILVTYDCNGSEV